MCFLCWWRSADSVCVFKNCTVFSFPFDSSAAWFWWIIAVAKYRAVRNKLEQDKGTRSIELIKGEHQDCSFIWPLGFYLFSKPSGKEMKAAAPKGALTAAWGFCFFSFFFTGR